MLRIALLVMLENGTPGQAVPRAYLRIGGATLAQHQLGIARALGCQRLVCLARTTASELIALQHGAEAAGMKFHILTDARGLSALVTATDELVVISEGLLADPAAVAEPLGERPCVLVQPVEGAVEAGFERIDLNYASAGVILIAGDLVENLHELPADCDVPSALTRIALQHGVRRREVPASVRAGARWRMVANETEAHGIEDEWLRQAVGDAPGRVPGFVLSRAAALAFGSSLLESGSGIKVAVLSVMIVLAAAVGAGWLGLGELGFLLTGFAWVLAELYGLLGKVERKISGSPAPAIDRAVVLHWLCDLVFVVLAAWEVAAGPSDGILQHLFAPAMLILLLRILPCNLPDLWGRWIGDRTILALVLAVLAASGIVYPVTQLLAVCLALATIATVGQRPKANG